MVNHCRALTEFLKETAMQDAWQGTTERPGYTHYSTIGASRLDRICVTRDLSSRKWAKEKMAVAFTDHLAVSLHLLVDVPILRMGRGYWKLDATLIEDTKITEQLTTLWGQLKQQQHVFRMRQCGGKGIANEGWHVHATSPSRRLQGTSRDGKNLFFSVYGINEMPPIQKRARILTAQKPSWCATASEDTEDTFR
jgi:hypothetical protein